MSEPLLKIPNHHAATCGDPTIVSGHESHVYIGYFENEHGEQWIFTRDRRTDIATHALVSSVTCACKIRKYPI